MKTLWNKWYAYTDENGSTSWDVVNYELFERWAVEGQERDECFASISDTAEEFTDNIVDLAIGEQRHIPITTRVEFVELAEQWVQRWNKAALAEAQEAKP
jgi:hypothetical protein